MRKSSFQSNLLCAGGGSRPRFFVAFAYLMEDAMQKKCGFV